MIKKPSMQSKLKTGDLPPIPDTTPNKTGKTPSKKIKKLGGKANRPPVSKNKTKKEKVKKPKGDKSGILGKLFKKGSRKDNRTVGLFKSGKDYNVEPEYILDEAILAGMEFYDSLHGITTPEEITIEDTTVEDTVVFIEEDIAEPIDLIEFPNIDEEPIVEDNSDIIVLDELPEENQKNVNISEQELISEDTEEEEDIKFEDYLASDVLSSKIYNIDEIED